MTQEELIKLIKWERKQHGGGQQVSVVPSDVILSVNELGIKIEVGYHRSYIESGRNDELKAEIKRRGIKFVNPFLK